MARINDTTVLPYKCIGKLLFQSNNIWQCGTGCFIGKSTVLTAAHNIYCHNTYSTNFTFIPGYYNNGEHRAPFEVWKAKTCIIRNEWASNNDDVAKHAYDFGLIILNDKNNKKLSNVIETSITIASTPPNTSTQWKDVGYPNSVNNGKDMVYEIGNFVEFMTNQARIICRTGDALGEGASGGPWILRTDNNTHIINGLNSFGYRPSTKYTYSPLFCNDVVLWITNRIE